MVEPISVRTEISGRAVDRILEYGVSKLKDLPAVKQETAVDVNDIIVIAKKVYCKALSNVWENRFREDPRYSETKLKEFKELSWTKAKQFVEENIVEEAYTKIYLSEGGKVQPERFREYFEGRINAMCTTFVTKENLYV